MIRNYLNNPFLDGGVSNLDFDIFAKTHIEKLANNNIEGISSMAATTKPFYDAFHDQVKIKQDNPTFKDIRDTESKREALARQLYLNLIDLLRLHTQFPDRVKIYYDLSLIRRMNGGEQEETISAE